MKLSSTSVDSDGISLLGCSARLRVRSWVHALLASDDAARAHRIRRDLKRNDRYGPRDGFQIADSCGTVSSVTSRGIALWSRTDAEIDAVARAKTPAPTPGSESTRSISNNSSAANRHALLSCCSRTRNPRSISSSLPEASLGIDVQSLQRRGQPLMGAVELPHALRVVLSKQLPSRAVRVVQQAVRRRRHRRRGRYFSNSTGFRSGSRQPSSPRWA